MEKASVESHQTAATNRVLRIPSEADQDSGLIPITVPGQSDQRSCVIPIGDRRSQET